MKEKEIILEDLFNQDIDYCFKYENGEFIPIKIIEDIEKTTLINLENFNLIKIPEFFKTSNLINLEVLNLSNNKITKIENLENCLGLEELKLSNNKITKIENLSTLLNLEYLILDNNKIKSIENLSTLIGLGSLLEAILTDNPLEYNKLKLETDDFLRKSIRLSKTLDLNFLKIMDLDSLEENYKNKIEELKLKRKKIHQKIKN